MAHWGGFVQYSLTPNERNASSMEVDRPSVNTNQIVPSVKKSADVVDGASLLLPYETLNGVQISIPEEGHVEPLSTFVQFPAVQGSSSNLSSLDETAPLSNAAIQDETCEPPNPKRRCSSPYSSNTDSSEPRSVRRATGGATTATEIFSSDGDISGCSNDDDSTFDTEEGELFKTYPVSKDELGLTVVKQPETNHRARYKTEGSRGCIKDRTGSSCPTIQVRGISGRIPVTVQIFLATESGPVQPHPLYQAVKAGGKNTTPCRETVVGNTAVLEVDGKLSPENNWTIPIDCVGIMKLRNTDIKDPAPAKSKRIKRSRRIRLAFRVKVPATDGPPVILQILSAAVACTALPGFPEIHHVSHIDSLPLGGTPIVILGRNFVKDDSTVFFQKKSEDDEILWEAQAATQTEHFHSVHIVAAVPAYLNPFIREPVEVWIVVRNKGKQSEPHRFMYIPDEDEFVTKSYTGELSSSIQTVEQSGLLPSPQTGCIPSPHSSFLPSPQSGYIPSPQSSFVASPQPGFSQQQSEPLAVASSPAQFQLTPIINPADIQFSIQSQPGGGQSLVITLPTLMPLEPPPSTPVSFPQPNNSLAVSNVQNSSTTTSGHLADALSQMMTPETVQWPGDQSNSNFDNNNSLMDDQLFNELLLDIMGSQEPYSA